MKIFSSLFLVALLSHSLAIADEAELVARPTMEQVEVSLFKKDFSSAIAALRRFPQADRDKKWGKLVERAAVGHLITLFKETPAGITQTGSRLKKEFPQLRKSNEFLHLHARVAGEDLRLCLTIKPDGYECSASLYQALKDSEEEGPFYLQMAKLVAGGVSVAAAIPFLKMAEDRSANSKGCTSADAQGLLLLGLQLPAGPSRKMAQQLALGRCSSIMLPLLKNARTAGNPHFKESLCEMGMCSKR